ncbi:ROK family protein [Schleiferilactobacillus harbinensis]|jgi:predicted NBD/HSP70 family sugar kinase|uniref:ROK family protein n=1 Tax=Schleiferilactobacillus harbinensis TaxID=304207 RepID=UPI00242F8C74|nr:ROK family protein [Schleiferilactobacillus harbinensis]MCI1686569.1 ROK family protein [Schleiferilactobacillus harbinensis]MCI1783605.1 ROK family protein [Schleiferilactobacillus harbinensis]MCI1850745.1 ROK family protein [Schleiferilactobacillus harbinensis]
MATRYLSIDIGGSSIKYALMDGAGKILEKGAEVTPNSGLPQFMATLNEVVARYADQIKGIAVAAPGKVGADHSTIHFGGALPFLDGLDLRQTLAGQFDGSVVVENDGKAAALAELWLGNLKGIDNGAAIVLGTGIGGGIVLNGRLLYGSHQQAGEFSFMSSQYDNSAFIESAVGSTGSAVRLVRTIGTMAQLADPGDGHAVFELINGQKEPAWTIFKQYAQRIAALILSIQAVVDVDRYVIGGGISAQPIVVRQINQAYSDLLSENEIIEKTLTRPEIVTAKFQNDANLFGALYSYLLFMDK